ncbi:MAG: UDP-N-acetylmuramate dehydrogenase [Treponema sp.]|nr:UDP-N-acetylmuramate dehydrogenase [Treponema sp.]
MNACNIEDILNINKIDAELESDADFKDLCTFKVGGKIKVLVSPKDVKSFTKLISVFNKKKINYFILGGGSNIVPPEKDFKKIVLSTKKLNKITYDGEKLICGSGAKIDEIIQYCKDNSLTGMENFCGLPGTIGGAVYMNARCYDKSISDILLEVKYVQNDTVQIYKKNKDDWDYKVSPFQKNKKCIVEVFFEVKKGHKKEIIANCENFFLDRYEKGHFKFPSAGSVFKNNRNYGKPSGKIIDEAGLCGKIIGGAQIAPWHGNFIINTGKATADDIKKLVNYVKMHVKKQTGFKLDCEIIFL